MKAILYDLDGTLIDHFGAIHRCCVHVARELGRPEPSYELVRATVGGSVPITLGKLLGVEHVERALPLFHGHFSEIMFEDLAAIPGAEWLLRSLHARGCRQAVFTNKDEVPARAVLEHLGLSRWLHAVIGTGVVPYRKPQPEFTLHALRQAGGTTADTILVGDSPYDHAAAEAAGLRCFLVATGTHTRDELRRLPGTAGVYGDLFELGEALLQLAPDQSTTLASPQRSSRA
jgi:phosphoglycolate phosphatase